MIENLIIYNYIVLISCHIKLKYFVFKYFYVNNFFNLTIKLLIQFEMLNLRFMINQINNFFSFYFYLKINLNFNQIIQFICKLYYYFYNV